MVDTRFPVSLHIMTALAHHRPELMSSEQLAKGIRTNPSFIRKLVVSLSAAGLVESVRGKMGGVRLVKDPKDITLDQIYLAVIDSALMPVPDKTPNRTCQISCSMGTILCSLADGIEKNTHAFLAKKTLKDILEEIRAKDSRPSP